MISYDEHRAFLKRQVALAEAEFVGFLQSQCGELVTYSPDPDAQRRFERGYQDGKAKKIQDERREA